MYFSSVSKKRILKPVLTVLLFAAVLCVFMLWMRRFEADTIARQKESLERAIARDIAECYAMEGVYPPGLDYMKEHYALAYDERLFFVDYRPIGGNLYPDCYVVALDTQVP